MRALVVPKLETEAEEAQWWYDNRDVLEENFIEAIKNGTIHRGGPAALLRETRAELYSAFQASGLQETGTGSPARYTENDCRPVV
jgi:hypothetical protein